MSAYCPRCETDLDPTYGVCPACSWDPGASDAWAAPETEQASSYSERYRAGQSDLAFSVPMAEGHPMSRGRVVVLLGAAALATFYAGVMVHMGVLR